MKEASSAVDDAYKKPLQSSSKAQELLQLYLYKVQPEVLASFSQLQLSDRRLPKGNLNADSAQDRPYLAPTLAIKASFGADLTKHSK